MNGISDYIERMFNDEVRNKKKIGRGVYNRASRTGRVGLRGVKTASDYMTKKQIRQLSGEIKMSNKYYDLNNISSWDELQASKDNDTLIDILKNLRNSYTNKELCSGLKISNNRLYKIFNKYDLTTRKKTIKNPRKTRQISIRDIGYGDILSQLPTYVDFYKLDKDIQRKVLLFILTNATVGSASRVWDAPSSSIYTLADRLGALNDKKNNIQPDFIKLSEILPQNTEIVGDIEKLREEREKIKKEELDNNSTPYEKHIITKENVEEDIEIKETIEEIVEENVKEYIEDKSEEIKLLNKTIENLELEIKSLKEYISEKDKKLADTIEMIETPTIKVENENNNNSLNYNISGEFSAEESKTRLSPLLYLLLDEYKYNIELKIFGVKK